MEDKWGYSLNPRTHEEAHAYFSDIQQFSL